jgi:hypothetical protein
MALNHPRFSVNGTGTRPSAARPNLDDRSRRTAEALAPRYEQLNQLWAEAESRLKAMQVPRYAWVICKHVPIDPEDQYSADYCDCLGLVKYRGEWRLCSGSCVLDDFHPQLPGTEQPTNWRPISDCTVEERVEAAPHLGKLREAIVVSAEHYVAKVDEAIAQLTTALERVPSAPLGDRRGVNRGPPGSPPSAAPPCGRWRASGSPSPGPPASSRWRSPTCRTTACTHPGGRSRWP